MSSLLEGLTLEQVAGVAPVRRTLDNGVEVVVVERPGCGLMSAQVWVRSGSLHEGPRLGAGVSHYLEHMVFKGTERMTGRQLTDRVHEMGATANAYTTLDRTVYHIDGPEEGLDGALEALSEQVLAPQLLDADARTEREVILREIDMCADDHDGVLAEAALAEAFRSHPLRHPVIGHRGSFAALTPEDLRAYHAARYTTDNLVVAVSGSVPVEQALASVERWFGRFGRRSAETRLNAAEPPGAEPRVLRLTRDVSTARGVVLWRTPGILSPDSLPLDIAGGILGAGRSSRLWRELRERRKLVHAVSASTWGVEDSGLMWVGWSGDANTDAEAVESAILEVVGDFLRSGPTEAELAKARRQAVVGMVNGSKTVHGAASRAGYALAIARDELQPLATARQLASLGSEAVRDAARRALVDASRTAASMRAKPQEARTAGARRLAPAGDFEVRVLPNGVRVLLQQDDALPKVSVGMACAGGLALEAPGRAGSAALLATLLARDTARRSRAEVSELVDRLGLTFRPSSSGFSLGLWGEGLSSDFAALAELVADGMLGPRLDPDTFARERAAQADACREDLDEVVELGRQRLLKAFFGDHPLGRPLAGTAESVESIQLGDLSAMHRAMLRAGNLVVGFAGQLDRPAIEAFVAERLATLPAAARSVAAIAPAPTRPAGALSETVDREQAIVLLGFPHCGFAHPRIAEANVTEELLSGMASGLFRRVREEKGLAYFVGASRVELADQGMFYLYGGTHAGAAATVEAEMRAELARLAEGRFEAGEVESAKRRLRVARREARQSCMSRLGGALFREISGLGANYEARWEAMLAAVDEAKVAGFVRDHLRAEAAQAVTLLPKG
ncbi:MAG: M16 family metallopeptidase [Opitutia bacterium]